MSKSTSDNVSPDCPWVAALVPAAGSSARMGAGCSKLLLRLNNQTFLERTVITLSASPRIAEIVVLARRQDWQEMQDILRPFPRARLEEGGASRQESVRNGVFSLRPPQLAKCYVMVHDAARALISPQLIEQSIDAALVHQAITSAVPLVDSLLRTEKGSAIRQETVDRSELWAVQTPQVFRYDLLLRAHQQHVATVDATDDASLVAKIHPVTVIPGERSNIKITTVEDLEFAKRLIVN